MPARADGLRQDVAAEIQPCRAQAPGPGGRPYQDVRGCCSSVSCGARQKEKRSADADEANLNRHVLPKWKGRAFASISRGDVIELIERLIAAGTPTMANRIHSLASVIFSFAIDAGLATVNPCARLKKRGVERAGRRVLSDAEIRLFWSAVVELPISYRVGLGLRLILLTGVRAGEAAGLALAELAHIDDKTKAGWEIPTERVKNGRAHFMPLSPMARAVVMELRDLDAKPTRFLFPTRAKRTTSMDGHTFAVAMPRFAERLDGNDEAVKSWKATPPTPHDLRRTFATRLSELGVSKEDRDAVLNHTPTDVGSRHYDLYARAAEKRRAVNLWANSLAAILEHGAVVRFTAGKGRRQ